MTSPNNGTLVMTALIVWGMYRRIRRNIGRQKLRPGWIIFRIITLSLASLIFLAVSILMPVLAPGFGGGALLGVAFAFLGLRHTKFETTDDGHYYTPNTYIGLGLSALLLGRIAYRYSQLQDPSYQAGHPQSFQSPLTLFIIGLTVGYYLAYYIGLFVHTHDKKPAGPIS